MESADLRDELKCPICLNLFKDPANLKCGHNFCYDCILTALDAQEWSEVFSCPECREQHTERPMLMKNGKLSKIMTLLKTAYDEKVLCTYCDSPEPASKSCLLCEASFCAKHLSYHSKSPDHILTEPTKFRERKCSAHQETLKFFCSDDNTCICMSCWEAGDHKGHQVDLLNVASEKKKEKLRKCTVTLDSERQEIRRRIQNQNSHRSQEDKKSFAVTRSYTDLLLEIMQQLSGVEKGAQKEIRRQKQQIAQSISDLNGRLKKKEANLSRRIIEIQELCDIQDPLSVLKTAPTGDLMGPGTEDTADDVRNPADDVRNPADDVRNTACLKEGMIAQILESGLLTLTQSLKDLMTKRQFSVKEKSNIFFDLDTANFKLLISKDQKRATNAGICVNKPISPRRFNCSQVLSVQRFTSGTHYWEVDVSEAEEWMIGVASENMERKISGSMSLLGYNNKSWCLIQTTSKLHVQHRDISTKIDSAPSLKTVGVYLEYEAGRLSFYRTCDLVVHLHTFTTAFAEPLHAAFHVLPQTSIRIKT
ncbi:E3 ubiquitin/ISG15 ligase TRIM25-like [Rana temporaria]|uniref:E3 ubiquitin/ISG15 ligase TRIM25-like n=1 Tax=Rana temporaria TaxID=8407 RepID=UPI001AADD9A3|nr:E3 ubiquitin/ISG15 ligase TRIM25-like [Rana temporaria]